MRYILVTSTGFTRYFYTEGCASLYHRLYGGTLSIEYDSIEDSVEDPLDELLAA